MKRAMGVIALALLLVLLLFTGVAEPQSNCEQSAGGLGTVCTTVVGNDVVVTLAGREIARVPAPVKTISVKVPVPGPEQIVQVPGPVRTIIQSSPVPGPVRTVFVDREGEPVPVRTVLVPTPVPVASLTPQSPSVTVTPQPSPTPTPEPVVEERVRFLDREVRISVPKAIAISAGLLALGILAGLVGLFIAYYVGYKDSEEQENRNWASFKNELFGRK